MNLSENGARFIAEFEGVRLQRYNDPAPGRHCTVGIGHLLHHGPCDGREGEFDLPDEAAAWRLLIDDVARDYAPAVEELITVPLNQHQFDSLVSFTYNVGTGALRDSTLRRRLNAGEYGAVREELAKWNKAGGTVLPGLTRRRAAEADLFEAPAGPPTPAPPPVPTRLPAVLDENPVFVVGLPDGGGLWLAWNGTRRHLTTMDQVAALERAGVPIVADWAAAQKIPVGAG